MTKSNKVPARLRRNVSFIKLLSQAKPCMTKQYIKHASKDQLSCLLDCCLNVLKGNVRLTSNQLRSLRRHKKNLLNVVKKSTSDKKRRQILQRGGFLGAILKPVIGTIGSLLGL